MTTSSKKFLDLVKSLKFLCPVEVKFWMDHDRVNGDLGRVELWCHFEKTLKQFSASRRSAKAFLAWKFILFGLDSLCNWKLGDELRLNPLGNQFYRWIRTWRWRAFMSATSHHDHKKPQTIQAMTMLLTMMSHWLMQNGEKNIMKKWRLTKLKRSLKDQLQGNVELEEWWYSRVAAWALVYALHVLACLLLALLFMYFRLLFC